MSDNKFDFSEVSKLLERSMINFTKSMNEAARALEKFGREGQDKGIDDEKS